MSALREAIPLALAAAFSPAALLVLIVLLTAEHPRRLVFAYLSGAVIFAGTIGVGGLFLLSASGATEQSSRSASSSVDLVLGLGLLALAVWAWRRHHPGGGADPREEAGTPKEAGKESGLAKISHRATASMKWAFAAGILVYLVSPSSVAAIKAIADSGDSTPSRLLAVLICAICLLLFVEIPAVVMMVRPDGLKAALERVSHWLATNSWLLVAVLAGAVGTWLLIGAVPALV